ncbi:hypothetical protein D3C79_1002130 [compost metagenome]
MIARVGNQRRAGIGNQCDVVPGQQTGEKAAALITLVVLMAGGQGGIDTKVLQQTNGVTGVLGGNQRHIAEHLERPGTHVIQVADWRGHHVKRARSGLGSPWNISHCIHLSS